MIFDILFTSVGAALLLMTSYKIFQIYQLSSYRTKGVFAWFKNTGLDYPLRYLSLGFLSLAGMLVYFACFKNYEYVNYIGFLFFIAFSILFIILTYKQQKKTPLKVTPRVIRCAVITMILFAGLMFGLLKLGELFSIAYILTGVAMALVPFVVALAHIIMSPFEKLNNNRYKKAAAKKLSSLDNLIKIGITGSYGKTTAKNILAKMLETKFKVAYSPSSYNTPMGISRYVNESLTNEHEIFIAEMGARYKGDIKELAELVKPQYGLITSIGKQHLETFGSLENIISTKYELIEGLATDGVAVFNLSGAPVKDMFDKCEKRKFLCTEPDVTDAMAKYENAVISADGTSFDMILDGKKVSVTTKLLGKHIMGIITSCAIVAYNLGITLEEIKETCKNLEPVPHRLQLIDRGETVVIDDAYNSNPEGAKNALEVLSKMDGVKVIITPGLVEMGKLEEAANENLGQNIAKFADKAFLIGARGKFIKNGALQCGMSEENIVLFEGLNEAVEKLKEIEGKKAVLFENDLPDNY